MKGFGLFALATALIVGAAGWVYTLVYPTAEGRHAVLVSALVAVAVQLVGFVAVRAARRSNPIAAWGVGVLLRVAALAVFGLVVVRAFGLASAPALLSLATFFFLSTLIEPLLLDV